MKSRTSVQELVEVCVVVGKSVAGLRGRFFPIMNLGFSIKLAWRSCSFEGRFCITLYGRSSRRL